MEHFYVTLPSNSSYAYYGKQPMSHFKTKLARQLHVNVGEWEVGLAKFIYPISWHNVLDGTFSVRKLIDNKWGYVDGKIPASKYESAAQLIETLETAIRDILGNQNNISHLPSFTRATLRFSSRTVTHYTSPKIWLKSLVSGIGPARSPTQATFPKIRAILRFNRKISPFSPLSSLM